MQGYYLASKTSPLYERYFVWQADNDIMCEVFDRIRAAYGIESALFKGYLDTFAIRPTWRDASRFKDILDMTYAKTLDKPETGHYITNEFCKFLPMKEISIDWSDKLSSSNYQFIQEPIPHLYFTRVDGAVRSTAFDYNGDVYCEIIADGDIVVDKSEFTSIKGHVYMKALEDKLRGTSTTFSANAIEPRVSTTKTSKYGKEG